MGISPPASVPSSQATDAEVTAAVAAAVAALVASAPSALDTLDELAAALGDDASFATTVTNALAAKVAKSLYDANTVLAADTDDTPAAVTMAASTILARLASGNIKAATADEIKTLLGLWVPVEPLYQLASGNWATGTNFSPGGNMGLGTGQLMLRYFTARVATPINTVATYCQVVHSGTGPTIERVGIWSLDANGIDLAALVASTANDTALWGTTGKRTKALQAQWTPVVGQRYAIGALSVSVGTVAQIVGITGLVPSVTAIEGTPANGTITGLTDLPASGAVVTRTNGPYAELIP